MCKAGGPRCASSLRNQISTLKKQIEEGKIATNFRTRAKLDHLQKQYDGTRTGQQELQKQIDEHDDPVEAIELENRKNEAYRQRREHVAEIKRKKETFQGLEDEKAEIESLAASFDNDGRDYDKVGYHLDSIQDWKYSEWTDEERENFRSVGHLSQILNSDNPDWDKADEIMDNLNPMDDSVEYQTSIYSLNTPNNHLRRDKNIIELAETVYWKKKSESAVPPALAPEREVNENCVGLREAQLASFNHYNEDTYSDDEKTLGNSAINHFDSTLNRVANGESYSPFDENVPDSSYYVPEHDRFMRELSYSNNLYYATAFPDNELKKAMEQSGVSNVSVTAFQNGREWGNAYTVITPDGSTRTFSVYEHRNTDSFIINGKTNWDGQGLPYAGGTKYEFYAELHPDDRETAARTLVYFMKSAQKGELEDDAYLIKNAPQRDWATILSESVPGFAEWNRKNYPEEHLGDSDEDVLRRLDF